MCFVLVISHTPRAGYAGGRKETAKCTNTMAERIVARISRKDAYDMVNNGSFLLEQVVGKSWAYYLALLRGSSFGHNTQYDGGETTP
jgi:hypothetical protein